MPISISCPQCHRKYQVRDELAGKVAKCPCGQTVPIPAAAAPAVATKAAKAVPVAKPTTAARPAAVAAQGTAVLTTPVAPRAAASATMAAAAAPPSAAVAPPDPFGQLAEELAAQPPALQPLGKRKKGPARRKGGNPYLIPALVGGAVVAVLLVALVVVIVGSGGSSSTVATGAATVPAVTSPPAPTVRWATPEAVFDAMKTTLAQKNWREFLETWNPKNVNDLAQIIAMPVAMLQMIPEQMGGEAVQPIRALAAKYGFDKIQRPSGNHDAQDYANRCKAHAAQIEDKRAFVADVMAIFQDATKMSSLMALSGVPVAPENIKRQQEGQFQAMANAQLSDVKITGDHASGTITVTADGNTKREQIRFVKIAGEWRVDMDMAALSSPSGAPGFGSPPGFGAPPGA